MKLKPDTRSETADVWWSLSAWATLRDAPDGFGRVSLAPSALPVAPLGAAVMHIATVFWPAEPPAEAISVSFVTRPDQPQGRPTVWVVGDTTDHDFVGLFRAPFGFPQVPARIVDPFPVELDGLAIQQLQILDRLPPIGPARPPRNNGRG